MNEKLKSERTALLGINSKASPYLVGVNEFQDLRNLDFQTPGALTQRWGSTQYIGQTFTGPITSLYEYTKLSGASYIFTSHSGGIWYGATTGQYQGLSLGVLGQTYSVVTGFYNMSWGIIGGFGVLGDAVSYLGNPQNGVINTNTVVTEPALTMSDNALDYVTFQDYLFMADGNKYLKFDGSTFTRVGLPFPALVGSTTGTAALRATVSSAAAASLPGFANATFASYAMYISYLSTSGEESQIWPIAHTSNALQTVASSLGGSFVTAVADISTPFGYGITAIKLYTYASSASMVSNLSIPGFTLWNPGYVLTSVNPVSGSTVTTINLGAALSSQYNLINNIGTLPDNAVNTYFPVSGSTFVKQPATLPHNPSPAPFLTSINTLTKWPRYLELYKNRVFAAGYSSMLSSFTYSELGDGEALRLDSNVEMRTNDGDYLSCVRAYATRLYFLKKNSFQALYGDNPANFYLQEISQTYGCLNNNCAVIYNDLLLFLDRGGIMQYNGSALSCISDKINPIFDRMNYNAAVSVACMVHDKLRNQILIGIPVDGSTTNNLTIVYDYLSGAWTYENGFTPTVFAAIKGYNNTKNAFYGTPSGTINWFGPSFLADNGVGFTCSLKTSWFHDMGETIEKQFRRLYTNITPRGVTFNFNINFYQDYGASVVQSATLAQSEFQERTDYGIPAKSLAFEMSSNQTLAPLQITALSIESRLQRKV